jgi:Ca-activated chloride channel homolog
MRTAFTRCLTLGLLCRATALALGAVDTQQPATFRSSVQLVPVWATVTAADGSVATDLTQDDFIIKVDGRLQDIESFSHAARPISVCLILDTSLSMSSAFSRVAEAGELFLRNLGPSDRATVGTLTMPGPPLTNDHRALWLQMKVLGRDLASPVWASLDRAISSLAGERERRAIVIYTDGADSAPTIETRVRVRVMTEDVMVYVVGFEGVPMRRGIKSIAADSGGRAVELTREGSLGVALIDIANELHHQYLMGFAARVADGRAHTIEVRTTRPGLTVRARRSYLAAGR